jgi:hypothetical protein
MHIKAFEKSFNVGTVTAVDTKRNGTDTDISDVKQLLVWPVVIGTSGSLVACVELKID